MSDARDPEPRRPRLITGYHHVQLAIPPGGEEDRRRHSVTDGGVVVVTADDEPLIGPISDDALRAESDADRGAAT